MLIFHPAQAAHIHLQVGIPACLTAKLPSDPKDSCFLKHHFSVVESELLASMRASTLTPNIPQA